MNESDTTYPIYWTRFPLVLSDNERKQLAKRIERPYNPAGLGSGYAKHGGRRNTVGEAE